MTVELTPRGELCQLACTYCYQHPVRDGGNVRTAYDVDAMIAALDRMGQDFTVFGGEALLTPIDVLERVWAFGFARFKKNGVQTNGALITDAHVALFRAYAVHVGFSIDGPVEMNDARWAGSLEKTRESTARSQANLDRLLRERIPASLIVTLHALNASRPDLRDRLKAWLGDLAARGLKDVRLHVLEVDHESVRERLALTNTQKIEALLDFDAFERAMGGALVFDIFRDIEKSLQSKRDVTCTWNSCDPYTTPAVQGVDGQGHASNCGRTNKDGVAWLKASTHGRFRQLALYETPREHGGCQGCRFFLMCNGQCPGTAIDGDWRNRSQDCEVYYALFETKERELLARGIQPTSLAPDRPELEAQFLAGVMGSGDAIGHGDEHGDHTDAHHDAASNHQDHNDHGDSHEDHGDAERIDLGVLPCYEESGA